MNSEMTENVLSWKQCFLGIEFGSTRIKAVLIDESHKVIAQGNHDWENQMKDGIWTYSLKSVHTGLQDCYRKLKIDVKEKYQRTLEHIDGIGISAMMHGYLVFDKQGNLLTPFRTWRNTMSFEASEQLTKMFDFHIPQRWSIAHLYQAMLKKEEHVSSIAFQTTLAGYVHYVLTNEKVLGIGEASGMFPIDMNKKDYDECMVQKFDGMSTSLGYSCKLRNIFPSVLEAGKHAGVLSKEGAILLDPQGDLKEGIPFCPPEGDAGTGMVATNSIKVRSGNVSAGTSVFAMVVLEHELKHAYEEIDIVTTPVGDPVAMVHCNNGTSELHAWVSVFKEMLEMMGSHASFDELYTKLFNTALLGVVDGGGLLACNYLSGEHITGFEAGFPLFIRKSDGNFNLSNFMLTQLYSSLSTLKMGMDILIHKESVMVEQMFGHGGFFKTPEVGQKIMSAAMRAPLSIMETAGEGGAWGSAILAAYRVNGNNMSLSEFMGKYVFADTQIHTIQADDLLCNGFDSYIEEYKKCLQVERTAVKQFHKS